MIFLSYINLLVFNLTRFYYLIMLSTEKMIWPMKKLISGALCSSLLLVTGCNSQNDLSTKNTAIDETTNQVRISGVELNNLDKSIRPGDNFYRYTNGGWLKNTVIPSDKTNVGSFTELRDKADSDVKAIIESLATKNNLVAGSDEQKVADLFRSYMDIKHRDTLGLSPIQPILTTISQIKSKQELAVLFAKYQTLGINNPLAFYIGVDNKDSSRYATHIWQSGLGLPDKDYYLKEDTRFATFRAGYLEYIENMFSLAQLPDGKQAADTVMSIEKQLAKFHWSRVATRDSEKRYNKFATSELTSLTDAFDWSAYLTAQGVGKQKDIIINQPDFIQGFGEVFAKTSVADWQTYLTFHTLSAFASYTTADLDQADFNFYAKQLSGQQSQKPLWKRGVAVVNSTLGEVIGKIYVAHHFAPEAKSRMITLVENLRDAYGESIDELTWMSSETKKAAHVKLAGFTPKIGYPDKWEDYSKLTINNHDLVGNLIRAAQLNHKNEVAKLGGPIQRWVWEMTPQTVNAYYNPPVNEIVFPAAILQPPFFNIAADDAVNYGGIGAVIGHEMGHGFDDQGSKYDADGNLRNWWTNEDLTKFKQRTDSLVSQYNQYKVYNDLAINGELTLGENIGDLSGVTIAYKAYKASLKGKKAPIIDGLTGDQRFFMGYAQIWRVKMVEKAMRKRVATDPHSPGEFRALGSLANMDAFYQAFDVKPGDAMYIPPEKRVKIW